MGRWTSRPGRRTFRTALGLVAIAFGSAALVLPAGAAGRDSAAAIARLGAAPASQPLHLLVPLRINDAALTQFAQQVSTPGSPLYGQYASVSTLAERFGASSSTRARVFEYLQSHGATSLKVDPTHSFIYATMSVADAQRAFATPLARFRARGQEFVAPTSTIQLPPALQGAADGVLGLDTEPVVRPRPLLVNRSPNLPRAADTSPPTEYAPATGTPSGCSAGVGSGGFTPSQYLTAYNFDPLHAAGITGKGERVAVIEIDGFSHSDLLTFARCFGLDLPAVTTYTVGLNRPLAPGGEATLDLEVLDAAAPDLGELEVFESNADTASLVQSYLAPLVSPNAKPQIISSSVGLCEQEQFANDNGAGIRAAERVFRLHAATGISILAASGDDGSADCISGEENNPPPQDQILAVDYPASSAFVTGVGGTQLVLDSANHITNQFVWNSANNAPGAGGGGGLSELFARPSYQKGVVGPNRRGVPDISALADFAPGYAIFCTAENGCDRNSPWQQIGGTSAAAPLMAGAAALINQDLHKHDREYLGLMNPLIYYAAEHAGGTFSDVTQFSNDVGPYINGGNGQPLGCCTAGPGYDLASGWGSMNVANFASVALQVLPTVPNVSLKVPPHQHPVRAHQVTVSMVCSKQCIAQALLVVHVSGQSNGFEVTTKTFTLKANRMKLMALRFNARQESRLANALAHHQAIFAEAYGGLLNAGGFVLKLTAARRVQISS